MSLQALSSDLDQCCLHQMFELQAAIQPDAIALVFEDMTLSYAELNRLANQLAHYLHASGVRQDSSVGIYMERSVEMIVGLLGILKAGGAYVPLDPNYPRERLDYLLKDAEVHVLLTRHGLSAQLPDYRGNVILLDVQEMLLTQQKDENPQYEVHPEQLAYIIYTSGSTGQPKGAMIPHRAVVARMVAFIDLFGHEALQRQLHFISLSFDVSVEEIFPILSGGGTLCIHPAPAQESTQEFLARCRRLAITKLNMPVAYWHQIVNDLRLFQQGIPPSLRLLITGGESPSLARLRDWYHSMQQPSRFINVWGTTETTIFASAYETPQEAVERLSILPIGRPIGHTQIYILNEDLLPVSEMVPGELYIGGAGLGRGYLRSPDITASCFIPRPFDDEPGSRLYKTGDIGRYLPDGTIEFLGRVDQQVKIRGFRVELGEITAILEQHPDLRDVVVVVREDQPDDKRIVAYCVPLANATPQVEDLQRYLRERLPDFMLPAALVILRAIPLTPNGKIDQHALPDSALFDEIAAQEYVAPRTLLEQTLTTLCQTILGVERLGIYDNFFDLGGHSLHVTQIITRIRQMLQFELPIHILLEAPDVVSLAEYISNHGSSCLHALTTYNPLVLLKQAGKLPPAFFVHPGSGGVFVYTDLVKHLAVDRLCYGLQAPGLYGEQEPFTDLETMVVCYITAIRTLQPHGPYCLIGWSLGGVIAFEMARQLRNSGEHIARLILLDSSAHHFFHHPYLYQNDDAVVMANLLQDFSSRLTKNVAISPDAVQHLSGEEQVRTLVEMAKEEELLPESVSLLEMQQRLHVFKANIGAVCTYKPCIYGGDITLINAVEGACRASPEPTLGWEEWVGGQIDVTNVPGDHHTMFGSATIHTLAQTLQSYL